MAEPAKSQNKAFARSVKFIKDSEKELAQIYRGSLRRIRSAMLKISEKADWTLNDLMKFSRLTNLNDQIAEQLKGLTNESIAVVRRGNKLIVDNAYSGSIEGYTKALGDGAIRFDKLDPKTVTQAVREPVPGTKLSDWWKKLGNDTAVNLRTQIGVSLASGQTVQQTARLVKERMGTSLKRARTIARTEGLRAHSFGQLLATEQATEQGIDLVKQWNARLDARVRKDHASMDGKKADKDGIFTLPDGSKGGAPRTTGVAKQDINCRCNYTEIITDLDLS